MERNKQLAHEGTSCEKDTGRGTISTQIRIPREFDKEINGICIRDGMSKNGTMLMLMRMGLRLYNAEIQFVGSIQ